MRTLGDFGRLLAAVLAGLLVVGIGAALYPAMPAQAAVAPAGTRASAPAVRSMPDFGNPNGHVYVPPAARAVSTAHPNHVIGNGTPASCTSAAVVRAVALGGIITFNCGPKPVTITMTATAKVSNKTRRTVLDGGGLVTLSGGGKIRILYKNVCDTSDCWEQQWPQLIVQNITFEDAYSGVRQRANVTDYGGGAIFDYGGQLKVVNSRFMNNRCYRNGPDLGGAAIRAYGMYMAAPVYITNDTFRGNRCSNGAALSGLYANFQVYNSLMINNKAIGWGANPASPGTPGGGSGGAIYTDGDSYNLIIDGTVMERNTAREGGGAIFFVVDGGPGELKIEYSTLHHNPSGQFQNAPGIYDSVDGVDTQPVVIHSTIN